MKKGGGSFVGYFKTKTLYNLQIILKVFWKKYLQQPESLIGFNLMLEAWNLDS